MLNSLNNMWEISILYQGDLYRFQHDDAGLHHVEFYPRARSITPTLEDYDTLPNELKSRYESALIRNASDDVRAHHSLAQFRGESGHTSEGAERVPEDEQTGSCSFDW